MINVHVVPPEMIYGLWDKVVGFIEASYYQSSHDCTPEQLKLLLVRGEQTLFVSVDDEEITGAMTVQITNHPDARVAFITALGGKGVVKEDVFAQVMDWLRAQLVTKVYAYAKEAQARLYEQKAGFTTARYVVEKTL